MTRTILATALAALTLGAASLGSAGAALAGGKHFHGHGHFHGHFHGKHFGVYSYAPVVYASPCFHKKTFDKFGNVVIVKVCNYGYYGY